VRASSPYARATWEKQWREDEAREISSKIPRMARKLEAEAATIAKLVEAGERQAEIERQQWQAQQEQWRREEAERRRIQNIKQSREQLSAIIEAWGVAKQIEAFFEDAERRTSGLNEEERDVLLGRPRRARELIGSTDALQRFHTWIAPEER
jgi:GTP1/Obg family GTP-binding protein